jgi:hypothetical protein
MERHEALVALKTLVQESFQAGHRSTRALTSFEGGHTVGWYMSLHRAFREALDIVENDQGVSTQGSSFNFAAGSIIYDHRSGYAPGGTARGCIQVLKARPSVPAPKGTPQGRDRGFVSFGWYALPPSGRCVVESGGRLVPSFEIETSQDEFIVFLIAGPCHDWTLLHDFSAHRGLEP